MADDHKPSKRPRGRPREGVKGSRVRDYPAIYCRVPPALYARFSTMAHAEHLTHAELIEAMLNCFEVWGRPCHSRS